MTTTPPVRRVTWPRCHRIIASNHPPIDLFEDVADPADWEALVSLESKSNPRVLENVGALALVPRQRRVSGPGASWAMAPFVHVSPRWAGRFHDGRFGAYYAGESFETAVAESAFHRARFYRASGQDEGWFSQYRELVAALDAELHDLRDAPGFEAVLDPDAWGASQELARALRERGSDGICWPSVRRPGGECLAAFWPDVVGRPRQGRHLGFHFDGERVDLVRDERSGAVWRLS